MRPDAYLGLLVLALTIRPADAGAQIRVFGGMTPDRCGEAAGELFGEDKPETFGGAGIVFGPELARFGLGAILPQCEGDKLLGFAEGELYFVRAERVALGIGLAADAENFTFAEEGEEVEVFFRPEGILSVRGW